MKYWLLLALCLLPLRVAAATPVDDAGRKPFVAALAHFDRGEYQEALKQFSEAWRLSKYPVILYHMARCEERLGKVREAIDHLDRFLANDPNTSRRASVDMMLANLHERERLAPRPPAPTVELVQVERPAEPPRRTVRDWRLWVGVSVGAVAIVALGVGLGVGLQPPVDSYRITFP
jgi:tetratricopeptide (TPR) repeat protein